MAKKKTSKPRPEPWETGEYGTDEAFIKVTDAVETRKVDDALDLKMISIRLQNDLINKLKLIARYHGIGYQVLMRNALHKFANDELVRIASEIDESQFSQRKLAGHEK